MLYCECENCTAQDEADVPRDQSKSRRMLLFYNAVAAELRKTHPEAQMLVGAYHVYNWPPKDPTLRADPMINVIITHYEDYCMAHSVADESCPRNTRYRELIRAWQKLGCKVYFYEYYWKVNWMDLPWPIVHSIAGDMPYYQQIGVQGVYTQYTPSNIWTLFPGHYVAARLLWDVHTDVAAMMDEMYVNLFGKAAPAMKVYYETLERQMAACGQHFPGHGLEAGPFVFTGEVLQVMRHEYERALRLNDDPVVAERLKKIGTSVEYTERLMQYAKDARAAEAATEPDVALPAATKARQELEALCAEILNDRNKWEGVVSRTQVDGEAYLTWELERIKKREAALQRTVQQSRLDTVAEAPRVWRFQLDRENVGQAQGWFAPDFDDSAWPEIEIGQAWEEQGYPNYDGYAWYRVQWVIEREWLAGGPLHLAFGAVDGEAWVYLNGQLLGHHQGWDEPFSLELKPEWVKPGEANVLAVRVFDGAGPGGIYRAVTLARMRGE